MQESKYLRHKIISTVDILPLDALRRLAEFTEFLQSQFNPAVPTSNAALVGDDVWQNIDRLEKEHPNIPLRNKQMLALLKKDRAESVDDSWWDDFEADLRQNRLTFSERDIV